jgi:hypothetical protein
LVKARKEKVREHGVSPIATQIISLTTKDIFILWISLKTIGSRLDERQKEIKRVISVFQG